MSPTKPLYKLETNKEATVDSLTIQGNMRRRFMDLGIVPGSTVKALYRAFSGDPTAYLIQGTVIAIRKEDAAGIMVKPN